jgi:hypothetical protein
MPCLGFSPSEVSPHRKCRFPKPRDSQNLLLPCDCSPNRPGGTVPALSPSVSPDSRLTLGPPVKETFRASPRDPERSEPRKAPRFHLSNPSRLPSGELPHSPADYGLPLRSLDPAITGHVAKPSRSPWARSTRATAQIRFTSLRSFAFCESVHVRSGCPTPHGRSSLGFLPL